MPSFLQYPSPYPVLYSFRRCPYAMRARLAIAYAECLVELREVALKDKPAAMLHSSPKGTVPVLVLPDDTVIDESLDVMLWALARHDPDDWLLAADNAGRQQADALIVENDGPFKQALDRYKYADRYPEHPAQVYRARCEEFLQTLEQQLTGQACLVTDCLSIADMALFPFVRQFAHVDKAWFDQADYPHLQQWLRQQLDSPLFARVMHKYPLWQSDTIVLFPFPENRLTVPGLLE